MPPIQYVFDNIEAEALLISPNSTSFRLQVSNAGAIQLDSGGGPTSLSHLDLTNIGTNTHAQLDTYVAGVRSIAQGGTGQTSAVAAFDALSPTTTTGDLIYFNGTDNIRLGIGSTGHILTVVGGAPAWVANAGGSPLTTKGDLYTFTTINARLAVGTNGQMLVADSSQTTGLRWTDRDYAAMTITGNATVTPIATQSVAIEIAGVSAAGLLKGFSHTADPARLTKTSADTKVYEVQISATILGVTNANVLGYMIAKNGAVILTTRQTNTVNGSANRMNTSLVALVSLAQNDYIQMYALNDTSTSDLTVQQMSCTIEEAGV